MRQIEVAPVAPHEGERFHALMQANHYLGSLCKIGETLWYVATYCGEWVALLSFSAAALKTAARDHWIDWSYRKRVARLRFVANNTRFCILPGWNIKNLGSRTLALCEHRLSQDWLETFGHPILMLETFVGEGRSGTVYQAANWLYIGDTRGFRRIPGGYSRVNQPSKKVFVRCLHPQARKILSQSSLDTRYTGEINAPKLILSAAHLYALPSFFQDVCDPRRVAGRRHTLSSVLTVAAGAYLCGARSYQGMSAWAEQLTQEVRQRIRCRCVRNAYQVPNVKVIRTVLRRVDQGQLQSALQRWNAKFGVDDASLIMHARDLCLEESRRHQPSRDEATAARGISAATSGL